MAQETLVAVFDSVAHADAAVAELTDSGIKGSDIERHSNEALGAASRPEATEPKTGFWSSLFGGETTTEQNTVYDRTVQSGGEVVTILLHDGERDADRVMTIVERHGPIDVSERAASYGQAAPATMASAAGSAEQTLQLSEESLQIGKRSVDRGTTRLHRFVRTETVAQDITLRDETVSVERRAVAKGAAVGPDAFTDKVIEMTETDEEAVVAKTAHVVEEIVLHKDVAERTETIQDTLRREQVEIEQVPAAAPARGETASAPPAGPRKAGI